VIIINSIVEFSMEKNRIVDSVDISAHKVIGISASFSLTLQRYDPDDDVDVDDDDGGKNRLQAVW